MSRGRTPRPSQRRIPNTTPSIARAVDHVQFLERRQYLTTLSSEAGSSTSFNYLSAGLQAVRITLVGEITAEFTAARIRGADNSVVIRDLIPAVAPPGQNPTEGADLYNIFVAEAAPDAQILISSVPNAGSPARDATPYGGSVGAIRANDNDPNTNAPNETITPDGTGNVYIGARTVNLQNSDADEGGFPITVVRNRGALGVRPAARAIYAGIQTAPGVSLDRVFIGGTLTGIVNMGGNVNTFYAGNILTGSDNSNLLGGVIGLSSLSPTLIANNFQVAGDLQNLVVSGSIGGTAANTRFRAGTQVLVRGRLGNLDLGGQWVATLSVLAASNLAIATPQVEPEYKLAPGETEGTAFFRGLLGPGSGTNNDTENNGVFAATGQGTGDGVMAWSGTLLNTANADSIDNYNLPLLAGQRATIQTVGGATLSVFDPLGRLVATDAALTATTTGPNDEFQIVADLPGIYRLQLSTNVLGPIPYTLTASGVGNVTTGGANVAGNTRLREPANGIALRTGDLGGWFTQGDMTGNSVSYNGIASPIALSRGNLRSLYTVGEMGIESINDTTEELTLSVPRGSVGYLRAGLGIYINPDASDGFDPVPSQAIGGDYQRIQAGESIESNIVANGRIGTIVAEDINAENTDRPNVSTFQPIFSANTDGVGPDGTIDMIYITDDVGNATLNPGGPALYTGQNGNVKYFFVADQIVRDPFFGGTLSINQTFQPGQSVNITDDSGAVATIRPVQVTNNLNGNAIGAGATTDLGNTATRNTIRAGSGSTSLNPDDLVATDGTLTLGLYGVRGAAGQIVVNATSTTSMTITTVSGAGGTFDVTNMVTNATGSPVQEFTGFQTGGGTGFPLNAVGYASTLAGDAGNGTGTGPGTGTGTGTGTGVGAQVPLPGTRQLTNLRTRPVRQNDITMNGRFPINVMQITGNDVTSLTNTTTGEIGSGNFSSIGNIVAQQVGRITGASVTRPTVPTNVTVTGGDTDNDVDTESPFTSGFDRAIDVDGSVITVSARDGVGSMEVGDTLGVVQANADGRNARGVFDGIDGVVNGNVINNVQIGEGIAFGGTGTFFRAGVFADDRLVNLAGVDADIRGPVVANNSIGNITLNNGSIIGTTVGTFSNFSASFFNNPISFALSQPATGFGLNQLRINGNGGVIGSQLVVGNFGNITIGGFGMFTSALLSTTSSRPNGTLSVGGLGIRLCNIDVGSTINTIAATGNGRLLDVNSFSASVRQTGGRRRLRFDPSSGRLLDASLDLNRLLGTSPTNGRVRGVTNSGVIQDSFFVGGGDLTNFQAYAVTSTNTTTPLTSSSFPMQLVFANSIGTANVISGISGLRISTGDLGTLNVGGTIARTLATVAGNIDSVNIGRTMRGTVTFNASNEGGTIGSFVVGGSLFGQILSNQDIGSIAANILAATIAAGGGINRIGVTQDVLAGANIRAADDIGRLIVGGNIQAGAVIDADDIGVLRVGGTNNGTIRQR